MELHPKLILKSKKYAGSKKVKRIKHKKIDFEEMNSRLAISPGNQTLTYTSSQCNPKNTLTYTFIPLSN